MGPPLYVFGTFVVISIQGGVTVSKDILGTDFFGPSGPTFITVAKGQQRRAPVLLEPMDGEMPGSLYRGSTPYFVEKCELPVLVRASQPTGGTVIVCPPLPPGRYALALKVRNGEYGSKDVSIARVFSEAGAAEWAKWCEGWGLFFRIQDRRGEEAVVYALGRALLGDSPVKFNDGTDGSQGRLRNEFWIKAALADAIDVGDWERAAKLALAFSVLTDIPWHVNAEILRHMSPGEVHALVPQGEELARELFGHLPRFPELRQFVDEADLHKTIETWYRWHIDASCLSRKEWPGETALQAAVSGLDFPAWVKASDGTPMSECAMRVLGRFLGFELDISGMPVEERTRIRKRMEQWLKEKSRLDLVALDEDDEEKSEYRRRMVWDGDKNMFVVWDEEKCAYGLPRPPPLLEAEVAPAEGSSRDWSRGFAVGIGAGALLAVLCYLAARVLRRALSRSE